MRISQFRILRHHTRAMSSYYENWSREELIARLGELEGQSARAVQFTNKAASSSRKDDFNFYSYRRHKIALKFCYSGWEYGGLAYQSQPTALPTVEAVVFDALSRTKLIDPAAGFDGCGWERCGRTDRGVSAAGQVISLWVRSALVEPKTQVSEAIVQVKPYTSEEEGESPIVDDGFGSLGLDDVEPQNAVSPTTPENIRPEFDYISILNRVLPPTIRMLAWSPVSDGFSSRYACKYRHYKYFFSSDKLDVPKMQDAASRLLGSHDFRNLCKLDPGKQITVFDRKILRADIDPVESLPGVTSPMYVLNLVGTAFLYHQVRHIMAVLLLVGRGLEHPSVVSSLLNVKLGAERSREGEAALEVVECKPEYQMADALPLMLWDCGYSDTDIKWRTDGHKPSSSDGQQSSAPKSGAAEDGRGLYHLLHSIRSRSEIYLALNQHFLKSASMFFAEPWVINERGAVGVKSTGKFGVEVPLGGGASRKFFQYVPLLKRKRLDPVEVVNERWRKGKGFRKEQRKMAGSEDEVDE